MRRIGDTLLWPFRALVRLVANGHLWIATWLAFVEAAVITGIAFFCFWRAIQYGLETSWKFRGVLPLLHENWRGAVFLGAALFYRTILIALSRMTKLYDAWGERQLSPAGERKIVDAPPTTPAKGPGT